MGVIDVYLSASIKVARRAKDGKDGVGITSADVVFAQSKSNTNPPADTDVWKTKVDELSLVDGYLWSGTKIIYSNKKIAITGKYCIGSTRDFTDIEELYYLSDSGDKIPTNVTFQSSFKPEKGKYLWTCIRYRFKAQSGSAENTNWVYSTPTCAGYFGDDGVSVQSSDVVFAISESKTTAPTTGWITNFGGLTLAEGKYVWTCTKTTLTDGDTYYTGAYCLGECYDFAQVEELYALSDSSTNPPENANFSSSYKVVKGKYLWSCVKVTYNSSSVEYLNIRCVNYFPTDGKNGNDGTSFNLLGTAAGHMKKWTRPSKFSWGDIYLVDGGVGSSPMTYKITMQGDISAKADVGDAYIIAGNLWVANASAWVNVGNIQGADGMPGEDGEDALNIDLSSDKLVFNYEDSKFKEDSQIITLVVKQGNTSISRDDYTVSFQAVKNFELGSGNKNILIQEGTDRYTYNFRFQKTGISFMKYIYGASVNGQSTTVSYPASSCAVKMLITYNGITYTKIISIEVSYVQMYGKLAQTQEGLYGEFGQFKTDVDSRFTQTASAISLKADAATLTNFKTEYDENGKVVNKRIGEIEVKYYQINIRVENIDKSLKDTGFDITNNKILATANHFEVQNNKGVTTFTIDENGNLTSSGGASFNGKITATSGYIGGLEIYNDEYKVENTTFNYKGLKYQIAADGAMPEHVVNVRDRGFYVGYGNTAMGGYFQVGIKHGVTISSGGKKELSYGYFLNVSMFTTDSVTGQSAQAAKFMAGCNKIGIATALEVNAYGGRENYAVDAPNGDIRAQAGNFRAGSGNFIAENGAFVGVHLGNVTKLGDYDSGYTLKKTDSTIVCNNTAKDISVTLPSDAVVGTFYRIIKRGKTVTFQSSKKNIALVNNIDLKSSVSSGTAREWINCLWDGDCWNVEMSRS